MLTDVINVMVQAHIIRSVGRCLTTEGAVLHDGLVGGFGAAARLIHLGHIGDPCARPGPRATLLFFRRFGLVFGFVLVTRILDPRAQLLLHIYSVKV